jgi:hypothetical protein
VGGWTEGANAFAANDAADAGAAAAPQCIAERPSALSLNRWQEDWSALANPCVPRKPSDAPKYITLGSDPSTYLSLGANLRGLRTEQYAALRARQREARQLRDPARRSAC